MSEFQTRLNSVPSGGFLTDRDKDKKPILDVRELGIDFGGLTAVDGFNLMIGRNEITGLIGPNGAGKTTVFNLRTNVYQPTRGSILNVQTNQELPFLRWEEAVAFMRRFVTLPGENDPPPVGGGSQTHPYTT